MAAAAGILALSSCVEDAIAPLTGKYEKPVEYVMTELKSQSVEKGEKTRTFTVELAGSNASLNMKFVGDKYYLHDAAFTAAPADAAKVGNYIVGNGGSTFTLGGNTVNIDSGSLTVAQADGKYTFNGNLWLADESVVKVNATVALVYEADPEPVIMANVLSAQSNLMSGVQTVSLSLAQEGISSEMDMTTYQTIWHGEGNYMSMDIYSADGYLHEGTYTACAVGGTVNEGEFGIGYDNEAFGDWGKNWGTCWWTVANGAAAAQKILAGTITVTKKGSKWEIELISGEGKSMIWGKFTGEIPALTEPADGPGGGEPAPASYTGEDVVTPMEGYDYHIVTVKDLSGNVVASFETLTESGAQYLTGTYTVQGYPGAPGLMGNGWDAGAYGSGGTSIVSDGVKYLVQSGTILVERDENGRYTFSSEDLMSCLADYTTMGPTSFLLENVSFGDEPAPGPGEGGGDTPAPGVEYTELTNFLKLTSYVGMGSNLVGVELATSGVTAETDASGWMTTYFGDGNYLKLELYSTDGTIAAGTYNACATGGTVGESEFGIGYDGAWGASGTAWNTVTGGAATYEYITDGTVVVAVDGDTYTITLESTVVNAKYVGKLSN